MREKFENPQEESPNELEQSVADLKKAIAEYNAAGESLERTKREYRECDLKEEANKDADRVLAEATAKLEKTRAEKDAIVKSSERTKAESEKTLWHIENVAPLERKLESVQSGIARKKSQIDLELVKTQDSDNQIPLKQRMLEALYDKLSSQEIPEAEKPMLEEYIRRTEEELVPTEVSKLQKELAALKQEEEGIKKTILQLNKE